MERITLLSIAIFLFASITKAQITKSSVYLGGSIGASTTKLEYSNTSTDGKSPWLSINPTVGVAIKDDLIAGINLTYTHGKTENFNNNQNNERNGYGAGVLLRKYYPLSNRFYLFGESGLGYFHQKWEYLQTPGYNYTSVNNQNSISANLFPGLAIHVTKSFYFEAAFNNLIQIGYSGLTLTSNSFGSTSTTKQKDFYIQSSLTNGSYLNIGVRFIIPKK
jgi:hypothetical protein